MDDIGVRVIERYLEEIVAIDSYLGKVVHAEPLDDGYVIALDLLDGEYITISPCYESEIIVQRVN